MLSVDKNVPKVDYNLLKDQKEEYSIVEIYQDVPKLEQSEFWWDDNMPNVDQNVYSNAPHMNHNIAKMDQH